MSILDIVIAIVAEAKRHTLVLRQSRELITAICDNTWKTHAQLAEDPEMNRFYPLGREGVRHQLCFMMLALIVPLIA